MVGVVLLSRRLKVNPDNIATPIAASLGDLTTLALLAGVGSVLYTAIGKNTQFACIFKSFNWYVLILNKTPLIFSLV